MSPSKVTSCDNDGVLGGGTIPPGPPGVDNTDISGDGISIGRAIFGGVLGGLGVRVRFFDSKDSKRFGFCSW